MSREPPCPATRSRPSMGGSTVDLSHHNVDACIDRDDVGKQMALDHLRNCGKIHERRRPDAPAHRLRRSVRYHIVALLPLGLSTATYDSPIGGRGPSITCLK